MSDLMMTAAEVGRIMELSERSGYSIIKQLNAELAAKGYLIRAGRIPRKYFFERTGLEQHPVTNPAEEAPDAEVL